MTAKAKELSSDNSRSVSIILLELHVLICFLREINIGYLLQSRLVRSIVEGSGTSKYVSKHDMVADGISLLIIIASGDRGTYSWC